MWAPLPARNARSKDAGDGEEEQAVTGWREVSHVRAFVLQQRGQASVGNYSLTPSVRDLRYMNKIENIFWECGPLGAKHSPRRANISDVLPKHEYPVLTLH